MRTLVVGCSGGMGLVICRRLKEKGHGVIGIDVKKPADASLIPLFYQADLNQTEQIFSVCNQLKEDVQSFYAIIYLAGIYPAVEFEKYSIELWDKVYNINVRAAFILCQNLANIIEDGGRIITIGSSAGQVGSTEVAYGSSKAAMLALTKSLALNLVRRGILVNAISPGPVETPILDNMASQRVEDYKRRILLHRFGKPEEIAVTVEFLLSPENTYMTGATVDVNGGVNLR